MFLRTRQGLALDNTKSYKIFDLLHLVYCCFFLQDKHVYLGIQGKANLNCALRKDLVCCHSLIPLHSYIKHLPKVHFSSLL